MLPKLIGNTPLKFYTTRVALAKHRLDICILDS